jgi:hypothetical protein
VSSYVLSPYIFSGILRTYDEMLHGKSTGTVHTVPPQNVQIYKVQLQKVQLPNGQLQNVQDTNVQDTKRPVFVNCKLGTVHTEQGLSRHGDLKGDG